MPTTLTLPITLTGDGALATLVQDTPGEVGQAVALLLITTPGERRCEPGWGTPAMLATAYRPAVATAAITAHEPRAAGARVSVVGDGTGSVTVKVALPELTGGV